MDSFGLKTTGGFVNAQKLGFFLIILGLVWGMYLLRLTLLVEDNRKSESDILKKQIIELSKRYIKALAKEGVKPQDVIKGKLSQGMIFVYCRSLYLVIWLLFFKQRRIQFKPIKRRLFC